MSNTTVYVNDYKDTQYDGISNDSITTMYGVPAIYINQEEPTYKGNLLIEALPPIRSAEKTYCDMLRLPLYSPEERNYSDEYRLHAIYRLLDCIFPMPNNIEIDRYLSIVLRRGYVNKHIDKPEYIRRLKFTSSNIANNEIPRDMKGAVCVQSNNFFQSAGFLILGISGAGKTTAINNSLSYYPKVIKHIGNGDDKFLITQIPFIKIDCSYNGSIKGICQKFFYQIDSLLDTDYLRRYGKRTMNVDSMIVAMAHLAQYYALGVLIIDEIQHLKNNKNGEGILNFFVSMMNEINLPIVYIGTYKAMHNVLTKDFRHGRRSLGIGNIEWQFMKNDDEWDIFIKELWKFQWIRNKSPLTEEMKNLMYKKSLGITDRIVKLFAAIQMYTISSGEETITPRVIEKVANEKFILTNDMIRAFETEDIEMLATLEDMSTPSMNKLMKDSLEKINLRNKVKEIAQSELKNNIVHKKDVISELIIFMSNFGYNQKLLEKVVTDVVNEHGIKCDSSFIKKEIVKALLFSEKQKDEKIVNNIENKEIGMKTRKSKSELIKGITEQVKEIDDGIKD